MEDQILKMKNMWQEQKTDSLHIGVLIIRLNQIEKKAKIKRWSLIVGLIVLVLACTIGAAEMFSNPNYIIAYILITTALLIKLVALYKTKYGLVTEPTDLSNHNFIQKLNKKLNFDTKQLLIYMTILIAGLNFALLGLYEKGTIFNFPINDANRILYHLATILLFVVAYISNKNQMKTNRNNTKRLIEDLENTVRHSS